jgi:MFS family permease
VLVPLIRTRMSHTTDRPHDTLTFAVLALAVGSYSLLQSLLAPALVEIQHDLHTSTTAVAWVLTAFFLSSSMATPIAGRFGDMFGKKRVLVVVLVALAVGTLIAAIATSIGVMIAGRAIQGIGSAVLPLAFGIIRDEFPQERLTTGIAMIPTTLGVGGVLGIVLSGPITDGISYHWLFWIPLVRSLPPLWPRSWSFPSPRCGRRAV